MTTGLLLGCALGAALCLLVYALIPPRPQLANQINRWERQRAQQRPSAPESTGRGSLSHTVGARLSAELTQRGIGMVKLRANLALVDKSFEAHLVTKAGLALCGFLVPGVFVALLLATGINTPITIPAVVGLGLAGLFFWIPDLSVAREAEDRRTDLRRALSCYLDLVSMSLAGGRGVPQALPMAAKIGTGWAFELISDTLDHARFTGTTPWAAFAELGEQTGMQELQDLGGALLLVADDGAKVRASLTARASSQRRRQLAEAEGAAEKADQTIQIAQVVLAAGFFLFLGYPAVINVLTI